MSDDENDEIDRKRSTRSFKSLAAFNPLDEIRKRVSKDRVRYSDGVWDLDLTYITPHIIGILLIDPNAPLSLSLSLSRGSGVLIDRLWHSNGIPSEWHRECVAQSYRPRFRDARECACCDPSPNHHVVSCWLTLSMVLCL